MSLAYTSAGKLLGQVCGNGSLPGTVRIYSAKGYATVRADCVVIVTVR